jgi:threonine aldolase
VTVEIPLRRAAFTATPWDDLVAISAWAREHEVPFHLDGARIWEVQPWYGRPLTEITALADTVYVSFYKGLGGMGGCVLAGPKPFIAAARAWRHRYGGDLYTIFPFILTAFDGLRRHLPRMADYHRHATAIATALEGVPGVTALPAAPHGNSFQLRFAAPVATLEDAAIAHAKATGEWLFNKFEETPLPGASFAEVMIGEAALGWSPAEVAASVGGLMQNADVMRAAAD